MHIIRQNFEARRKFIKDHRIFLFIALALSACHGNTVKSLKPLGFPQEQTITLAVGDLKVVFVDNTALAPDHLAGYNGIASLRHREEDSTLFVPRYAGFNLEHIFGGDTLAQLFEPRRHPMSLFRKSETEVIYTRRQPRSMPLLVFFTNKPTHLNNQHAKKSVG